MAGDEFLTSRTKELTQLEPADAERTTASQSATEAMNLIRHTPSIRILFSLRLFSMLLLIQGTVKAQYYWDINGPSAGPGGPAPSGSWNFSAANWNNADGTATSFNWINDGTTQAVFSSGTEATGAYTVTLDAGEGIRLAALTLRSGTLSLTGLTSSDVLNFDTQVATITVDEGSLLNLLTRVQGTAGLVKSGTGQLRLTTEGPTGAWNISNGRLSLGASQTVTSLTLGGNATTASVLDLDSGVVLDLSGNISLTNLGQTETTSIQGGVIRLNGGRSIVIPNAPAALDLEISSSLTDGTESSSLTKSNNAGTLLLSGTNTYTGATILAGSNSGTILVQGNAASIAGSSAIVINGATLTLGSALDTSAVKRLNDHVEISLLGVTAAGATLNYQGSDFSTQTIHREIVGAIIVGGQNRSFITLTPGAGDEVEIQATSLSRVENGILLLRGTGLASASGTAESTRLFLDTAPTLVGDVNGTTNRGILPWALGDVSSTGAGTGFLTFDSTTGLRPLNIATEFVAPNAVATGLNVRKSATGNVTISSSVNANSCTNSNTGTVTLGAGVILGLESGAILYTANGTITGGTITLAQTRQGIIHLAAGVAVTGAINSVITGDQGLLVSGTGAGNKILVLGGDNTFTGNITIHGAIVQANHPGAFNSSGVNSLLLQSGSSIRLNGNNLEFSSLNGVGNVVNNSATLTSVLTIHGGGTHTGALNNGNTAALGLVKKGSEMLVLGGNNTYTGATNLLNGSLHVQPSGNNPGGNGGLRGTSEINIGKGTVLQINNGNVAAANHADRINDNASIQLLGSLIYNHPAANLAFSETLGALTLGRAASQITASIAGAAGSSILTFTNLAGRSHGGVLNFSGTSLGVADSNVGRNQIFFTQGVSEGFIGGWATVGNEFAKYSAATGVTTFVAEDSFTGGQEEWTSSTHAKPDTAQTLITNRDLLSLNLTGAGPKNVNLGGNILNIHSGGLIKQGGGVGTTGAANVATISLGNITAGGTAASAELFIRVTGANLNISAAITDNPGDGITPGTLSVVKSGLGTLVLTGNSSHSGDFLLYEGVVVVNNAGRTGSGSVYVGTGARLGGNGIIGSLLPGAKIELEPGGTLFVGQPTGMGAQALTLRAESGFLISGTVELDIIGGAASGLYNVQNGNNDLLIFTNTEGPGLGAPDLTGALLKLNTSINLTPSAWANGSTWKLFDWYELTSSFSNLPDSGTRYGNPDHLPDLSSLGLAWDWSQLYTDGSLSIVVPEPGRALLLTLGMALALLRRGRNLG